MAAITIIIRNAAIAALLGGSVALGGCGAGDIGVEVNAPILNAVGLDLGGKKKDDDDLPERPGLVVPPSTQALPPPGERSAAASAQNWPDDPDKRKKRDAEEKAAAEEKYCREGRWDNKAGIGEFEKNVGREQRCASKLGKALSKSLGGGEATQ